MVFISSKKMIIYSLKFKTDDDKTKYYSYNNNVNNSE